MIRTQFHVLLASGVLLTSCSSGGMREGGGTPIIVVSPTEPREQTADQQVQQVLNRLGFGPRPGDVARVREMGVDRWIALQLAPDHIEDTTADRVVASYELLDKPLSAYMAMYEDGQRAVREQQRMAAIAGDTTAKRELRADILKANPELRDQLRRNQRILGDVQSSKLARAVVSDRQLQEVMTDFWENHFTVFAGKGLVRVFIPTYDRDVIRPLALGKFRDLLGAVAKSPAMLFYLDQWESAADSMHPTLASLRQVKPGAVPPPRAPVARPPQARTRGLNENYARELLELHTLGVDGGYTQTDVIEVARALTGWTMNPRRDAQFTFRPEIHDAGQKVVLGHVLAAGRGQEDGEDVLDIVARDPHTAHFIARKLAIRFVSDDPPAALVDRAADTFRRTGGDIREVVRTIVTSSEFFSRPAYRVKVKSPFELVASALRAVGAQADTSLRSVQSVAFLGEPVFGHMAPNGWPETGAEWMNSGAILNRINFGLGLAAGRMPGASITQWSDWERLKSATREQQVDGVVLAFFGGQSSPDTREILLQGENPLAKQAARPAQLEGLTQIVGLALGAPEFQRR